MARLQREIQAKEQARNELASEKELSEQYKEQRDSYKTQLDLKNERLVETQRKYELETQIKRQLATSLERAELTNDLCQTSKTKHQNDLNLCQLTMVNINEEKEDAELKLNNCRSNSVEEKNAVLLECEAGLKLSEMERIKVKKEWMDKWRIELEKRMNCNELTGILEKKIGEEKNLLAFTVKEIKTHQTLFNQRSQDAYDSLKKKYEKCEEEGPTPVAKPKSTVDLDPTCMGPEC